jgi:ppGpp synthetase/RelA/SpoT-type nucleotidyltranferase
MAWAKPLYGKGRIDWAGKILAEEEALAGPEFYVAELEAYFEAVEVVNNWRAIHSYPLHAMKMTLKQRARAIYPTAIIAQRLKRLASIKLKLKLSKEAGHHPNLSQMQDIGGCRAVMGSVAQVRELERVFAEASRKSPHRGPQYDKTSDYLSKPKGNGYRGVHLIYRYRTDSAKHSCYNGQRIEIQLRSRLQHYWATAVETYSTFTGEALKSNIGSAQWMRFFALVSSGIALMEKSPTVPGTVETTAELIPEVAELYRTLNVENVLNGWSVATKALEAGAEGEVRNPSMFLLVLDPNVFDLRITPYKAGDLALANEEYAKIEKEEPHLQAVLVSVDSLAALRSAYPNYFLDTAGFLELVRKFLKDGE